MIKSVITTKTDRHTNIPNLVTVCGGLQTILTSNCCPMVVVLEVVVVFELAQLGVLADLLTDMTAAMVMIVSYNCILYICIICTVQLRDNVALGCKFLSSKQHCWSEFWVQTHSRDTRSCKVTSTWK